MRWRPAHSWWQRLFCDENRDQRRLLKRKHVTLMIGTEDEKVDQAISIIQKYAGERKTVKYTNLAAPSGPISPGLNYTVPINVEVGGSTIFVMNVERFEKM
ncbi:MAG: cyclic-di-AMP receptor [Lachnospiraceae bacterium]